MEGMLSAEDERLVSLHQDDRPRSHGEDTPAYRALMNAGVLCSEHRRDDVKDIFSSKLDRSADSSKWRDWATCMCYSALPLGFCVWMACVSELFVPAGHVGLLMDGEKRYLFAEPGMHNIQDPFIEVLGHKPLNSHIEHGNRTIVTVEQGHIGYATDNGQPILLPPGIHVWASESLRFLQSYPLNDHVIQMGPYTLVTVDEGYAAVTQNNGRQLVLDGGDCHFLNHKNWKFEKFITMKIQTDHLDEIVATSADNIDIRVNSTINWRIFDAKVAATMAAETMNGANDLKKLRNDVLQQGLASLAAFIGGVNYSSSFSMAAAAASKGHNNGRKVPIAMATAVNEDEARDPNRNEKGPSAPLADELENPIYNAERMQTAVEHANEITKSYGVTIMSINIISCRPVDATLTKTLASGAVAAAEALQAETAAQGRANAKLVESKAEADAVRIEAEGKANAVEITAKADKHASILRAEGEAAGIEKVGEAVGSETGVIAMQQHLAEMYLNQLADMAKNSKMMIVPDKPNDVSAVLATAMSIGGKMGNLSA